MNAFVRVIDWIDDRRLLAREMRRLKQAQGPALRAAAARGLGDVAAASGSDPPARSTDRHFRLLRYGDALLSVLVARLHRATPATLYTVDGANLLRDPASRVILTTHYGPYNSVIPLVLRDTTGDLVVYCHLDMLPIAESLAACVNAHYDGTRLHVLPIPSPASLLRSLSILRRQGTLIVQVDSLQPNGHPPLDLLDGSIPSVPDIFALARRAGAQLIVADTLPPRNTLLQRARVILAALPVPTSDADAARLQRGILASLESALRRDPSPWTLLRFWRRGDAATGDDAIGAPAASPISRDAR